MAEDKNKPSEVLEDSDHSIEAPVYTAEQTLYLSGLQKRLEIAHTNRNMAHDEFDGMDYITRYEDEERLANSFIPPKKNKQDTNFISGTIRHKLLALLSSINILNLDPEYSAFDSKDIKINELGDAMDIVRQKADELDQDEEKKMLRQMELLKHGTVFVEKVWQVEYRKSKILDQKFDGKVTGATWKTKIEKAYEGVCSTVLDGRSVYLGDIRQPFISKQPYIFTIDDKTYAETKAIYGEWEMWKYVSKTLKQYSAVSNASSGMGFSNWRLLKGTQEQRCEILKYQDKPGNEFQIIINGIPMLPIGFPMPWKHGEYNIVQQILEFIHPHFAYGRSFVSKLKVQTALLDEMLRLAILTTQKQFMPPRANMTGRVLGKNIFMPGVITMGIDPDKIKSLSSQDSQGIMNGEMELLKSLEDNIDTISANSSYPSRQSKARPSNIELLELQRQAKMAISLTVSAMSLLEKKLGDLSLWILLENWFNPIDTEVDEARQSLKNVYRVANVSKNIGKEGMGNMMVIPTDNKSMFPKQPNQAQVMSENIYDQEESYPNPTRIIYLNVKDLQAAKITWRTIVNPTETGGSERSKQMFERMVQSGAAIGIQFNMDYLGERFAETWQENPSKLISHQQAMPPGVAASGINPGQGGGMKPPAKMPALGGPPGMPPPLPPIAPH